MLDTVKAAAHEHKDNHIRNHKTVLLPGTRHTGNKTRETPPLSANTRHNRLLHPTFEYIPAINIRERQQLPTQTAPDKFKNV